MTADQTESRRRTQKIEDEFAGMAISRQRKYQLRKQLQGLCTICGQQQAFGGTRLCYDCNRKRGIKRPGKNIKRTTPKAKPYN